MVLTPGTRLGAYEIAAQIGEGGMGQVFRATDTRLKRQVAIKSLPPSVAADAERLARFQREAEVLASLNHPNIAAIYGLEESGGMTALVMELVEGEDLSQRIARGAIPLDEALPIAKQIADALEAAHEQGIIHRDLKPANIKVRGDGTVKVLDFGLAKAMEPAAGSSPSVSMSPTITTPAMTQAGMILGTAAYMSPEQAKGRTVDRRADVWAFGAVFYEMLTGQRAFAGDDVSDTFVAIMRDEPDWARLPAALSPALSTFIRRCLQKDPKQRVQAIGDVRLALEGAFETAAPLTAAAASGLAPATRTRVAWMWTGTALLVGGLATAGALKLAAPAPAPQPVRRFAQTLRGTPLATSAGTLVAVSPDGRVLVYRTRDQGVFHLYRRVLGELEATLIPGSDDAGESPFFSPDGRWLGFRIEATNTLMKVPLTGGRPARIGELRVNFRGASWGADDSIVIGATTAGLVKMPAGGGGVVTLTKPDDGRAYWYPQILPNGRAVLFTASYAVPDSGDVLALDLQSGKQQTVLRGGAAARYVPTGHLVFVRAGALWAVRFNPATLSVSGDPVLVEQGIRVETGGAVQFACADDGTLVYIAGTNDGEPRTLVWVDRSGHEEPLAAPARAYVYPRMSPDGLRVALDVRDQEDDIWIWSLAGQTLTRLTTDPSVDGYPVWTPDSQRIVFGSRRAKGLSNLYTQRADGSGSVERLTDGLQTQLPISISPDGRTLVFEENAPKTGLDLMSLPLGPLATNPVQTGSAGDRARSALPLVQTPFADANGEVSPDGRWLAYQSTDSGRSEIYVRPFPDVKAGRTQVSSGGGRTPLWDRTGRTLYFRSASGTVMSVGVVPGSAWQNDPPMEVVQARYFDSIGNNGRTFDVTPDGKRFLMIKEPGGESAVQNIVVVTNWFEELKRLVPGN